MSNARDTNRDELWLSLRCILNEDQREQLNRLLANDQTVRTLFDLATRLEVSPEVRLAALAASALLALGETNERLHVLPRPFPGKPRAV